MNNLIDDPSMAQVREDLKNAMYTEMARVGDTFENNTYYEKNWVEDRIIRRTATIKG